MHARIIPCLSLRTRADCHACDRCSCWEHAAMTRRGPLRRRLSSSLRRRQGSAHRADPFGAHGLDCGWGSGVRRSPAFTAAGWTPDLPGRVQAPTLVIRGALDDQAPEQATRALHDAPVAHAFVGKRERRLGWGARLRGFAASARQLSPARLPSRSLLARPASEGWWTRRESNPSRPRVEWSPIARARRGTRPELGESPAALVRRVRLEDATASGADLNALEGDRLPHAHR